MTISPAPVFFDTNVLIYAYLGDSPLCAPCRKTIQGLRDEGCDIWVSQQTITEFCAVMTRIHVTSGKPLRSEVLRYAAEFKEQFSFATEDFRVAAKLLELLDSYPLSSRQVHDANMVATMLVNGVQRLVTHNIRDFKSFTGMIELVPIVT